MENEILYNYGLQVEELRKVKNAFHFYVNYEKYVLYKTTMLEKDIKKLSIFLKKMTNKYSKIIETIDGKEQCKINNGVYVLLKLVTQENEEITYIDMLKQLIPANNMLEGMIRSDWNLLWSTKVDYLEYQVSQLAKDHPIVRSSFSYYIGLAENAIEYYNTINKSNLNIYLMQKRIQSPNIAIDYYNPVTLVVDYKVREIAEYIKSYFFNEKTRLNLEDIINKQYRFSDAEYNLFFARLLYPTYFFDDLTEVLEHKKNEECLLKYINLASEYEKFLKKCLVIFSKRAKMIKVEWLL